MKTSELTGAALDWAVTRCEGKAQGYPPLGERKGLDEGITPYGVAKYMHYSTDWAQGGPIIEREKLQLTTDKNGEWVCSIPYAVEIGGYRKYIFTNGFTPLIAAMRCYVASKLGDEVEIPSELTQGENK